MSESTLTKMLVGLPAVLAMANGDAIWKIVTFTIFVILFSKLKTDYKVEVERVVEIEKIVTVFAGEEASRRQSFFEGALTLATILKSLEFKDFRNLKDLQVIQPRSNKYAVKVELNSKSWTLNMWSNTENEQEKPIPMQYSNRK